MRIIKKMIPGIDAFIEAFSRESKEQKREVVSTDKGEERPALNITARLTGNYLEFWQFLREYMPDAPILPQGIRIFAFILHQKSLGIPIATTVYNEDGTQEHIPDLAEYLDLPEAVKK